MYSSSNLGSFWNCSFGISVRYRAHNENNTNNTPNAKNATITYFGTP